MVVRSAYTALLLAALAVVLVQPRVPVFGLVVVTVGVLLRVVAMAGRARVRRAAVPHPA